MFGLFRFVSEFYCEELTVEGFAHSICLSIGALCFQIYVNHAIFSKLFFILIFQLKFFLKSIIFNQSL